MRTPDIGRKVSLSLLSFQGDLSTRRVPGTVEVASVLMVPSPISFNVMLILFVYLCASRTRKRITRT